LSCLKPNTWLRSRDEEFGVATLCNQSVFSQERREKFTPIGRNPLISPDSKK
jgi:hypothetical protein